ncbi:MAG: HD-GYP domain-containing protein [Actinomycetota bacterium]|nr:HD-GYP domain-containing protein [Actinomycetota bacterium]
MQVLFEIWQDIVALTRSVRVYLVAVSATASIVAAALVGLHPGFGNPAAVVGLAIVAAYGERGRIRLRGNLNVSISLLPAIFAAVLFGPLAAMVVFGASALGLPFPWLGRLTYVFSRALTGALAAGAVAMVASIMGSGVGETVVSATAAALVAEAADAGFASLTYWLRGHGRWIEAARDSLPVIAASVPLYSSAVAVLALSYRHISPWTLPLFFAPALAAQRWFLLYQEQRRLADDLQGAIELLRAANLSFANGLIATLDARDRYTAGHSAAVAIYARDIARRMGLDDDQQQLAHLCGLVHDIGKIGLPAGLLEKPGALTLDERREMQRHSEIGERILANVDTYVEIASVVRHHHERVDGQGYPDGLWNSEIPALSRIIAVADAYNAMTSDRPYREAMPSRVARLRLAQAVETQFDTSVVAAFEALLAGADEDYRLARGAAFQLMPVESTPQLAAAISA